MYGVIIMKNQKQIILYTLIFITNCIIFSLIWLDKTFSFPSLNQIIFHLKFNSSHFDTGIIYDYLINVIPLTMIFTLIIIKIYLFFQKKDNNVENYIQYLFISIIILSLIISCLKLNIIGYFYNKSELTHFYKVNYVNPQMQKITFQKKKHNLIHINLESIESTYFSKENGGYFEESLIPELEELALHNIHFSHQDQLGGALTLEGTQWTTASVIAQTSGITSSLSLNEQYYSPESSFLPGVYSLGDILNKEGYYQEVIMGSTSHFAGISNYFHQHGNYHIMDYDEAMKVGYIPQNYHVFWGYEDQKLFQIAKKEITKAAKNNQFFNFEIMTIDSHTPHGYICEQCPQKYNEQYKNVITCQSHQVYEFVKWLQQQDFYQDTTIVITGDHKSMSSQLFSHIDPTYIRTPYNCIINSVVIPHHTRNRLFNVVDMYPTILASIGGNIENNRLGIGTNLFSNTNTILEKYNFNYINTELLKTDLYYKKYILKKKELIK